MERRLRNNAEGIRKKARSTRRPRERSERLELIVRLEKSALSLSLKDGCFSVSWYQPNFIAERLDWLLFSKIEIILKSIEGQYSKVVRIRTFPSVMFFMPWVIAWCYQFITLPACFLALRIKVPLNCFYLLLDVMRTTTTQHPLLLRASARVPTLIR